MANVRMHQDQTEARVLIPQYASATTGADLNSVLAIFRFASNNGIAVSHLERLARTPKATMLARRKQGNPARNPTCSSRHTANVRSLFWYQNTCTWNCLQQFANQVISGM